MIMKIYFNLDVEDFIKVACQMNFLDNKLHC